MRRLLLAILSGFLLAFSWPAIGFLPIIFIGFIPLLILENEISLSSEKRKGLKIFFHSFLCFSLFNFLTTYWIYHATIFGAIMAFLINALIMSIAFWIFYFVKRTINRGLGIFVIAWISMEYLNLHWELAWPWLTLGNVFSNFTSIIQWYEFTGVLGGSIWILLVNYLLFKWWKNGRKNKKIFTPVILLLTPVLISFLVKPPNYQKGDKKIDIIIVQPNIDSYNDKFSVDYKVQLDDFISLAKKGITQKTDLLIGPETALQETIWEKDLVYSYSINKLKELQDSFPNLSIVVGANTFKKFEDGEKLSNTARQIRNENIWYDAYNSAIFLQENSTNNIYHKIKLVPGVEQIPYPEVLNILADFSVSLGGISGSLSKNNSIYSFETKKYNLLPLICYESIFGDFISKNISSNIDLITVITNDGWWKDTPGYKQHLLYAKLRAIEQRRYVLRAANNGISAIISSSGEIEKQTKWMEKDILKTSVSVIKKETFYSIYGDYFGRIASFFLLIFFLVSLVKKRIR